MTHPPTSATNGAPPEREIEGVGRVRLDPPGFYMRLPTEAALAVPITPPGQHYVMAHHGIVHASARDWTLRLIDRAGTETKLSLKQIKELPAREVNTLLECAGNPEDPGKPHRIVSNAVWRGPSLRSLVALMAAREARYVWSHGVGWGPYAGEMTKDYVKDMPIAKAMDDDVILAYEMNGAPLPPEHGFPLRLIVPGYYGTNSVKWLGAISLSDERPRGLFTNRLYNDWTSGKPVPVWEVAVNSRLLAPAAGARVPLAPIDIVGKAWGNAPVQTVDLSVDRGASWFAAELQPRAGRAWQTFRARWIPQAAGAYEIAVRARDIEGHVQPAELHVNQIQRVPIIVEA